MKGYKNVEVMDVLACAERAIQYMIDNDVSPGLLFQKGTKFEHKMSWKKALYGVKTMNEDFFGINGTCSFGCCATCTYWNTAGHYGRQKDVFGTCKNGGKTTHRYFSCFSHSKEGGGFGV